MMFEFLNKLMENISDLLIGLADGIATSIVNVWLPKNKKIKHVFKRKEREKRNIFYLPNGTAVEIEE